MSDNQVYVDKQELGDLYRRFLAKEDLEQPLRNDEAETVANRIRAFHSNSRIISRRFIQGSIFEHPHGDLYEVHKGKLNALYAYFVGRPGATYEEEGYWVHDGSLADAQRQHEMKDLRQIIEQYSKQAEAKFPPSHPSFPATPTYPISHKPFTSLWLKDESTNPTGTHKDREAFEIYYHFLTKIEELRKTHSVIPKEQLPVVSLISNGSLAAALQRLFNALSLQLPPVRVLHDSAMSQAITGYLTALGCHLYPHDLSTEELTHVDILRITENTTPNPVEATYGVGHGLEDVAKRYYDWFAFELLNLNPDYCIIPFGSGSLFRNVLDIARELVRQEQHRDNRYFGDVNRLRRCVFWGASCSLDNPDTIMDKLYTPYYGVRDFDISPYLTYFGQESDVKTVTEESANRAMGLAEYLDITTEPSGIAGLALLLQEEEFIPKDRKIVIVNTGRLKIDET